jgi:hypothetical protein
MSAMRDEIAALMYGDDGTIDTGRIWHNDAIKAVLAIVDKHEVQAQASEVCDHCAHEQHGKCDPPCACRQRDHRLPQPEQRPARAALRDDTITMTLPHNEVVLLTRRAIVEAIDNLVAAIRENTA